MLGLKKRNDAITKWFLNVRYKGKLFSLWQGDHSPWILWDFPPFSSGVPQHVPNFEFSLFLTYFASVFNSFRVQCSISTRAQLANRRAVWSGGGRSYSQAAVEPGQATSNELY